MHRCTADAPPCRQVGASGEPELLPREEHERLYLSRAAAEGREPRAKEFLAALQNIMQSVAWASPAAVGSGGRGGRAVRAAVDGAREEGGWENPREKRRQRRRRLWGSDANEESAAASTLASSPASPTARPPGPAGSTAEATRSEGAARSLLVEVGGAAMDHAYEIADGWVSAAGCGEHGGTGAPLSGPSPSNRERIIPAWRAWRDGTAPEGVKSEALPEEVAEEGKAAELTDDRPSPASASASSLTLSSVTVSSISGAAGRPRRKRRPPPPFLPTSPTTPDRCGDGDACSQRGSPRVGLKEKILSGSSASPQRDAGAVREAAERRHARAEAQRERLAAEEASRLRAQREREEAVRMRKEAAAAERRRALEEKLARAEAARGESLGGVVWRARTENQKVEEVAFINKVRDDVDGKEAQRARHAVAEAAYARWTAAIGQRASRAAEAARRREMVRERGRGAVATGQAALRHKAHQRSVDANQRRLSLVHALLNQRRERAERRDAAVQELRDRRGTSDGDAPDPPADEPRRPHRKAARQRSSRGLAPVSERSGRRGSSAPSLRSADSSPSRAVSAGSFEHAGAFGPLYASETDLTEGEGAAPAETAPPAAPPAPPAAPPAPPAAPEASPGRRAPPPPPPTEEELEARRRARARTKRVRSRMAAAAASVRLEQLDWLWSAGETGMQASKRLSKLAHTLGEVRHQPQSDGAEAAAWEVCKLLEGGRDCELHAARQHGILDSLVALAAAEAGGWPLPPRRSTQVASTRALLAACALGCNRSYLLLRNHAAGLATLTLACAVEAAAHDVRAGRPTGMGFDADVYTGAEAEAEATNLLLPLLQLLRLLIATPSPVEVARRMRSDLVTLLIASGGMHSLQEHCAARAATLAQATAHGALLRHYVGLLHALLLPLRDDPAGASCATALRELLRETRMCGVLGLACALLVEASHPDGELVAPRSADSPSMGGRALPGAPVLSVCRLAVQLLTHIGAIDAPLLRRTLGAGELKAQLLHLVHLALDLCAGAMAPADERGCAEEVRCLLHELLLLLGIFTHGSRPNAELLRWRKGEHPTMLHRLVSLPFAYFCVPRLRAVLLPTLLCGCFCDQSNTRILAAHLHPDHLVRFLREEIAAAPAAHALTPAALLVSDPSQLPAVTMDYSLAARLPPTEWEAALAYFAAPPEPPASPRPAESDFDPAPHRASPVPHALQPARPRTASPTDGTPLRRVGGGTVDQRAAAAPYRP